MEARIGILLLHGLTGKPSEMRPVQRYLEKSGFTVEAPLLAGHGGSHAELLASNWQQWLESAQRDLDKLLERTDQVVICGLSMGSTIGGILAARNSKVSGLIMLSPTFIYDGHLQGPGRKIGLALHKVLHNAITVAPVIGRRLYWTERAPYGLKDERLQKQITKAIKAAQRGENTEFGLFRTYYGSLQQMNFLSAEMRRIAPDLKLPVLIVSSLEDTLVSLLNASDAYSQVGSANKYLCLLTGCDHVLTLDLQRNYVCRLIGEFMETISGRKCPPPPNADNPGFVLELHNRLSPVDNLQWPGLIPDHHSVMELVSVLQRYQVHESDCHTMVMRLDNTAQAILPLFLTSSRALGTTDKRHGFQETPGTNSGGKNLLGIGIDERCWHREAFAGSPEFAQRAWRESIRLLDALCHSYRVKQAAFIDYNSVSLKPASETSKHSQELSQETNFLKFHPFSQVV